MQPILKGISIYCTCSFLASAACAAELVNMNQQSLSASNSYEHQSSTSINANSSLKIVSSEVDFNKTQHVRLQQRYKSYPIIGAEIVKHIYLNKKAFINGNLYSGINADLSLTSPLIFSKSQKEKVISFLNKKILFQNHVKILDIKLMVYPQAIPRARWVFKIVAEEKNNNNLSDYPSFIIDAQNYKIYQQWNALETFDEVMTGGLGGNYKTGKIAYSNSPNDFPALQIDRDSNNKLCYMNNSSVIIYDLSRNNAIKNFACPELNPDFQLYWNADEDATNGAYNPSNDAYYNALKTNQMFLEWFSIPVLNDENKPKQLKIQIHYKAENAYWDPVKMLVILGDGANLMHPFTSLSTVSHEFGHGFTQQHSHIISSDSQAGAINESFSDITGQAAEYFVRGKNNWLVAAEEMKNPDPNVGLRYFENPRKDGYSINYLWQYKPTMSSHYAAGLYNRAFYLLATKQGWDTHKAFNLWVQANRFYWLPYPTLTSFENAACGVIYAAYDYNYRYQDVMYAFQKVGIDVMPCLIQPELGKF